MRLKSSATLSAISSTRLTPESPSILAGVALSWIYAGTVQAQFLSGPVCNLQKGKALHQVMAFLEIRGSTLCNVFIFIGGLLFGGFLLLMAVANLIYPDVPEEHLALNTFMCLLVSFVSLFPLLAAVAALRGILHRKDDSSEKH